MFRLKHNYVVNKLITRLIYWSSPTITKCYHQNQLIDWQVTRMSFFTPLLTIPNLTNLHNYLQHSSLSTPEKVWVSRRDKLNHVQQQQLDLPWERLGRCKNIKNEKRKSDESQLSTKNWENWTDLEFMVNWTDYHY